MTPPQSEFADIGFWNVYLNPDMPNPQANLKGFVCAAGRDCSVDQGLASTIAQFKTPVLRDLEDSAPYFHNGSAATPTDVVNHYITMSALAHQGEMRNAPPEFANMSISQDDVAALPPTRFSPAKPFRLCRYFRRRQSLPLLPASHADSQSAAHTSSTRKCLPWLTAISDQR